MPISWILENRGWARNRELSILYFNQSAVLLQFYCELTKISFFQVRCFAHDNVWINEWKENEVDIEPPFKCDPKLIRRVTLANCTDLENGAITNCDVVCRGVKIDEV